jgi:hypothetical protein
MARQPFGMILAAAPPMKDARFTLDDGIILL